MSLNKRDLGPKNEVLIEGKTSPWDHARSIERKIIFFLRALRGLNDTLSVDNEPFYTFYRTLKRWTTEMRAGQISAISGPPRDVWAVTFTGGGRVWETSRP